MTDDDDDIYSDLSCINIVNVVPKVDEEKIKLQNLLEEKEQELNKIIESKNALEKEKRTLEENISSLYKTAINELKKKDAVIAELTRQKDTILFRRERRHNSSEINRNLSNATQTICNKQPSIENNEIAVQSAECKNVSASVDQKTSKNETVCSDETTVKHINKEDSSSDNSSVKGSTKYCGSKLDLPLKDGGERNSGSRSQSSERNTEETYSSYGQRSSRSAYNNLGSLRSKTGERSKGERSKDAGRHYSSYQGDRKRQRYDTQEDYRERGERYYPRSSIRSPSPKRSRRENFHQSYHDWKKRNSRSNYSKQPPSDSVRVATQVKSKYSKADRERSLSRTPVKKQKDMKERVNYSPNPKSSELMGRTCVISKLQLRNSAEKNKEVATHCNNPLPSKVIKVDHNVKNVPVSQSMSVFPHVRMEVERRDKEGIPLSLSKSVKDTSDREDVFIPSDKRTKALQDSSQVEALSVITQHRSKNSFIDIDSLGNDIETISTMKGHTPKSDSNIQPKEEIEKINCDIISSKPNLSSNIIYSDTPLKEDTLSGKSKSKNFIECSSRQNSCRSEEICLTPTRSTDIPKQNTRQTEIVYEQHLSKKMRDYPTNSGVLEKKGETRTNQALKERNKSEKVKRRENIPHVSYVKHEHRLSKDNINNTSQVSIQRSPLVDKGTDHSGSILSILPETQSPKTCEGSVSKSPIPFLTPPLKATVALKVSPSFEDPAVIKDHKFSYTVFNEQCDFHRPKSKKSVRLSGGSSGNESDLSSNELHKSDPSLYCNKLDEASSGKRRIDKGKCAALVRNPLTAISTCLEKCGENLLINSKTLSSENKTFHQKALVQVKQDCVQECPETNTKQTSDVSKEIQSTGVNEKGHLLSSSVKRDDSLDKTSLSTSKTISNHAEKSFSVNFDMKKGKDFVPVKGLQKNLKKTKENLSISKKIDETAKEKIVLNNTVKSEELKSSSSSGEKVEVEKLCVSSSSSHDNGAECDRNPKQKHTIGHDTVRVSSSEQERRSLDSVCNAVKANLEQAVEERKQELDQEPNMSKSDRRTPHEVNNAEGRDISDKSANETLKSGRENNKIGVSEKDVQKPKVQRTIIVSKFRRKNANFQDSPTPVLSQVKSNAK